ncbi:transcriptional regulator, GntR family [Pseudomonas taetrolens]|mgnify:CR=1 FL=1|uniref:Histidine utilization repressor n=1 Tax=Pseudomonas taetrolens TaxID=47884 RepID=A0A0J6GE28_PSETA|nr:histidine utilization repressor [Pseudomonas taetrolens]MBW0238536.1 histidine utilization repressor [Pseudomonas sp. D1HM]SEC17300.1 transcriptional regulator, GntR family [Pseudomonas taetrolens]SQF86089.1 histidine utilization repressor [Pseudomonas taetrolens]VEH49165.1 histidine utilization repressor [Pseudomonas taetrolens]
MSQSVDDHSSLESFSIESPSPLYARVKQAIAQKIRSGAWLPNSKLPSESELLNLLGVSRMTINRALRELTIEGLLVRMQGVGTFVAVPKGQSALFEIRNIAQEISERGHAHRCEVILLEELAPKSSLALPFALDGIKRVFHSVMVHHENDMPVQIEERFVNAAIAPDYLLQDFTRTTAYAYLMQLAPLTGGEHVVEAIHAKSAECRLLQIKRNEPCLLIRRRTWSAQGLVGSARLVYPGSRYRLQGQCGN